MVQGAHVKSRSGEWMWDLSGCLCSDVGGGVAVLCLFFFA